MYFQWVVCANDDQDDERRRESALWWFREVFPTLRRPTPHHQKCRRRAFIRQLSSILGSLPPNQIAIMNMVAVTYCQSLALKFYILALLPPFPLRPLEHAFHVTCHQSATAAVISQVKLYYSDGSWLAVHNIPCVSCPTIYFPLHKRQVPWIFHICHVKAGKLNNRDW